MRLLVPLVLLLCSVAGAALADAIILPAQPTERGQPLEIIYRLQRPEVGRGKLRVEWSDAVGRVVERRTVPFDLRGATDVGFRLETRRAITTWNRLEVRPVFDRRAGDRRSTALTVPFIISPPPEDWRDYQVIMWQQQTPRAYATLRRNGIEAGMLIANRAAPFAPDKEGLERLVQSDLRYYVENIATDFYSAYHRWFPDRAVNWRFVELQKRYRENHDEPTAFRREPSLSDPKWLIDVHDRLTATVAAHRAYRPIFYNLADEAGIADLAAYWDFDVSEPSLAAMRLWLKTQYADLAELNGEWGSDFASWDQIVPVTTRAAMRRDDQNFAAWGDFKAWMDVAFARAVALGRDSIHEADPAAFAGLEGVQVPGWGGYDYSLLAKAVDVMELGDQNIDLARSLNPQLRILVTAFGAGKQEAQRVWRAWLKGARGLILWDEKQEFVGDDGRLGPHGRDAMPYLRALHEGLGSLLINSERQYDPVAILYSPASMRVQWMLDWKDQGDAWIDRGSEAEGGDNTARAAMAAYRRAIERLGMEPSFLAAASIESGALESGKIHVLVMPHVIALSSLEARMIRRFVAAGGTIVADSEPGSFDRHGRKLAQPLLHDLFPAGPNEPASRSIAGTGKAIYLPPVGPAGLERLRALLAEHGVAPDIVVKTASGELAADVEMHRFSNGDLTIVALQRSPGTATRPEPIVLSLPRAAVLYDLRAKKSLGRRRNLQLVLDPFEPTLFALSDRGLPRPSLHAPARATQGATATVRIGLRGRSGAAFQPLHVEVEDPAGKVVPWYSGNLAVGAETISRPIPLALNDPVGTWRIRVTDVLSGQSATASMTVHAR